VDVSTAGPREPGTPAPLRDSLRVVWPPLRALRVASRYLRDSLRPPLTAAFRPYRRQLRGAVPGVWRWAPGRLTTRRAHSRQAQQRHRTGPRQPVQATSTLARRTTLPMLLQPRGLVALASSPLHRAPRRKPTRRHRGKGNAPAAWIDPLAEPQPPSLRLNSNHALPTRHGPG
jgi:hypothetical protein